MKPDIHSSRRKFLKLSAMVFGGLLTAPFAGFSYARYLEPQLLKIKRISLTLPRLPASFDGIRVVHFSDIHLDFHYSTERLAKLAHTIQRMKPDLICFTGDLYDRSIGNEGKRCAEILAGLSAPLGKWAVLGNHDHITGPEQVTSILDQGGFSVLTNRSAALTLDGASILIAGVDDALMGSPNLKEALSGKSDIFTLLLSHVPDFADMAAQYPVDLQLSGHSHGGQVRIPFYGHVFTPEFARKYPDGLYQIREGKFQLYTNRGIGVSTIPIRFWCRPELTVFTLRHH
ncbi:phosphoesterase [Paenibacillus swuensis]|uniref:Phosphoesterase n=1 Tax=Paenibacillus swuensis TaxID=1178515 RepID=A0A172TH30_9BACL|nr:metallophosphoesterase [Paenibacillus swuensis]ANE46266.1 phosphoesterase [Paenibacillus swuensis]